MRTNMMCPKGIDERIGSWLLSLTVCALVLAVTGCSPAADEQGSAPTPAATDETMPPTGEPPRPHVVAASVGEPGRSGSERNPLRNAYFGEQHLHTVNSPDAFAFGTRNTPDDAYSFAKGEPIVKSTTGETIQKRTPYDWAAVTDHSEYMGVLPLLLDPDSPLQDTEIGQLIASGDPDQGEAAFQQIITSASVGVPVPYLVDPDTVAAAWQGQKDAANRHYDPGTFTTLVAYEWSSQPNSMNLHHNVFFRDGGPDLPFSSFDSVRREDLWAYQEQQRALGHENFSIPHNANVSNSMMYPTTTSDGDPITAEWAARSARNSPATEIVQTKGSSETSPAVSPYDEFAGFEDDFRHLLGSGGVLTKVDYSFVRGALINGVGFQEAIGVNPYKFGIVAGADSHDAASDNEEFNYTGVHGDTDKTPEIRLDPFVPVAGEAPRAFGTPGATGVWAEENTRESIFDAISRKETFGTSGPLMRVRFFGGWGYDPSLATADDFVQQGYDGGVPMGGDLPQKPEDAEAPTFIVWALKDPDSGNLDRIQIVKGWYRDGYPFEHVYDVVWSDGRTQDPDTGKLPPVGNTVDVANATYTNTIGDTQLRAVWTDPDFDASQHAVYYVRAIEIPTPRWTTYDAKALGVPVPDGVDETIQERAWSSPIWYTPEAGLVNRADFYPGLRAIVPGR